MKSLMIGKVARRSAVSVETVRFYEREGLIPQPPRRESGYRQYPEDTVLRIGFIKRAKELGFTLREIKELLCLRVGPETTCDEIRKRAEQKIAGIEEKVSTLQKMKKALKKLTAECKKGGPKGDCPILEALEEQKGGA